MYSEVFCRVYNEFGWNYYPEAFGQQLQSWLKAADIPVKSSLDLACGTGVLCDILHRSGIHAVGMDLSEGMIRVARENFPGIPFEVADMIRYCPEEKFDLVTCTGDALNHIPELKDVGQIFRNVYDSLNSGGWFLFDLLDEREVSTEEPFDLDFSDTIRARFQMLRGEKGLVNLKTQVWEDGIFRFEENIYETLHDPGVIRALLEETGFRIHRCAHTLTDDAPGESATWFFIAQK